MFFGLSSWWTWGILFLICGAIAILARYRVDSLKSPHRELHQLKYSMILFFVVAFFVYWGSPMLFYHQHPDMAVTTLAEAQEALRDHDKELAKLSDSMQSLANGYLVLLAVFCLGVLPSIYKFGMALVPTDVETISIPGDDNE